MRGLSGKVLTLTILFVMIGEVLIFLPSIANFRIQWMKARIAQAEIAALAAEAAPDQILNADLRTEILKGAGVIAVSLQKGDSRKLMLRNNETVEVDQSYDLRTGQYYLTLGDALAVMFQQNNRVISVIDKPPNMSGDMIEVALHEEPLRRAMVGYGLNILLLSIVLSLIVAGLIFAALNRMLVQPIKRLSENMIAFGQRPDDAGRVIVPSGRNDELGMAEDELKSMQAQLRGNLQQKAHLASLGLAVSKVSHDLRNMLTTAQLISDRMADVKDPTVQRFAPKLFTSLDRAITFLNETIRYGRAQEAAPRRERLRLIDVTADVCEQSQLLGGTRIMVTNLVRDDISVDADREQLTRVLQNLVRNSIQALASERGDSRDDGLITISASRREGATAIRIDDNGPGIPQAVRDRLFEAFQSADRQGGTGLGLAIAAELVHAHLGSIEVVQTGNRGTSFLVTIPDALAREDGKVITLKPAQTRRGS
jgi:signal transduction histidine kinase